MSDRYPPFTLHSRPLFILWQYLCYNEKIMSLIAIPQRFQNVFSFFGAKEKSILGVDIGSASIKIVQLRKEKERAVLETYGELSLTHYAKTEAGRAVILVEEKLKEALHDVITESQAKASRATVSIPMKNSFITTMSMPELRPNELKDAIAYEARKYIPIPLSEAITDWWVLPPQSTESAVASIGSPKKPLISVLLVAVPNDVIEKYKNIFSSVGVSIDAFEIELFSAVRSARQENGTILLMDIGASSTKIAIIDSGVVRMAHSISQGGWGLTQALEQSLGLDFDRAESLKREFGVIRRPETQGAVSVLEPLIDTLAIEAERFLLDWKRKGGRGISKVFLVGGGSLLRGIEDTIVKKFGVETEIINPFSKVIYPAFLEPTLKEIGPIFANATGLALRGF